MFFFFFLHTLPLPSLLQGSQDSLSGQEGITPPFSVYPPLPPSQNGMPESEFNPGTMFAAGSQSAADTGSGGNGTTSTATSNSNDVCVCLCVYVCVHAHVFISTLLDD